MIVENRSSDVNDNNPILNQKDYTNIELKPTSSDKEKVVKSSIDIDNSAKKRQVNKNNLFDKRTDDSISSKASGTNTNTKTRDASSSLSQ